MGTKATGAGIVRPQNLPQDGEIGDHHRQAGHRGLDRGQSESFPARGKDEEIGREVEIGDVRRRQCAEKMEALFEPEIGGEGAKRSGLRPVARHGEMDRGQVGEGAHEDALDSSARSCARH